MKDQYFGDVNDYRKYGILRVLSCGGQLRTGVCWMLTPADGRTDGQAIRYLSNPLVYRHFDPPLFDHLSRCVVDDLDRRVAKIECSTLLPNTMFYSPLLQDKLEHRRGYFQSMAELFAPCDLIFFDPDNGLEVPSVPCGRRSSSKFLYWSEVESAYASGHSLLIYQHFPREDRVCYTQRKVTRLAEVSGSPLIITFRTSHVLFMLVAQSAHAELFRIQACQIAHHWAGCNVTVTEHPLPTLGDQSRVTTLPPSQLRFSP